MLLLLWFHSTSLALVIVNLSCAIPLVSYSQISLQRTTVSCMDLSNFEYHIIPFTVVRFRVVQIMVGKYLGALPYKLAYKTPRCPSTTFRANTAVSNLPSSHTYAAEIPSTGSWLGELQRSVIMWIFDRALWSLWIWISFLIVYWRRTHSRIILCEAGSQLSTCLLR
jgi:hypothetical protein